MDTLLLFIFFNLSEIDQKDGRSLTKSVFAALCLAVIALIFLAYLPSVEQIFVMIPSWFGFKCYKTIQLWSRNPGERGFPSIGVKYFKCPGIASCGVKLYTDTSFDSMRKSDALILFHRRGWKWDLMFAARPPGQKWIFYSLESPLHTSEIVIPPAEHYNDTYDYIMSYRSDSDFRAGYGEYFPNEPLIDDNYPTNWAADRPKLVAWVASNCMGSSWPRPAFVHNLSK